METRRLGQKKKKRWKKRNDNCWKIVEKKREEKREGNGEKGEKRENWRKNGKHERSGGERRKGENTREGKVGKPRGS